MKAFVSLGVAIGLLVPADASAQTATPSPYVVDAQGKVLGPLIDENKVVLKLPSRPPDKASAQTFVYPTGFLPDDGKSKITFFYKSENCSGPLYLFADYFPRTAFVNPENTTQFLVSGYATSEILVSSIKRHDGAPQCVNQQFSMVGALAEFVSIASLGFVPPFTIKLQ